MHIFKVLDICGQVAHKMGDSFTSQTLISSLMRRITSFSQSNCRDTNYVFPKRWVGKSPWRRQRLPTSVFWPGEFYGLCSPCGCKESDTSEGFSLSLSNYTCSTLLKVLVAQSCPTRCDPMDFSLPGSFVHVDSPGKNTGVGCHFLLRGIFQSQELIPCLLHFRQILYLLS